MGPIALGTAGWALSDDPLEPKRAERVLAAAVDRGVSLVDTALAYTTPDHESYAESLLGRALRHLALPDTALIATKGGHFRRGDEFPIDGRPATLRAHCEQSLRALGVETIGLYQLHKPDPKVPVAESMGAIAELQREGKVRFAGISNATMEHVNEASTAVTLASVQNKLHDGLGDSVLSWCEERQVAFLSYSPLHVASATLQAKIEAVAGARHVSPQRIRLAQLLSRSPRVIPIVGARRAETIEDSARAGTMQLTAGELTLFER